MPAINMIMVIQIILAFIIIIILYIVTLVILNIDSIVVKTSSIVKPNETTVIMNGYASASYLGTKSFNTFNAFAPNYIKIGKSLNTNGGSQLSYQFWIKIEDPNVNVFDNLIILCKGDKNKYKIGLYDIDNKNLISKIPPDYVIVAPLIKFIDSYRHLRVQFNTANSPMTSIDINMSPNDVGQGRRNVLSLLPLNWYLFTFVLEDNFSYTNIAENGINFKFWVNDFLYQENGASDSPSLRNNTLKQNDGDLFLIPNSPSTGNFLKMGNIKYFNYALAEDNIKHTYQYGPPTFNAEEIEQRQIQPAYLTAFNKIDVFNY